MKISFVIPAYNEEHYIGDCLDAIVREKHANPSYDVEIIVVNNASTDGTAEVVKKYPEVTLVNEPTKGIVHARRAGFLASTGGLIANVDSDTRVSIGWLPKVMKEFERNTKLVALSGPFLYYDAPRKVRFFTRFFYYVSYSFSGITNFFFHVGAFLQGGNFVVRRDALEKIGGYDTSLNFYGEDSDIARRLNKVGKVKFMFSLPAASSGRRLAKEGGLTMGIRYAVNYLWITFFKKPFTKNYVDIRLQNKDQVVYEPEHKVKEWIIAISAVMVFLVIVLAGAFVIYSLAETGTVSAVNFIRLKTEAKTKIDELSSSTENMLQEKWDGNGQ